MKKINILRATAAAALFLCCVSFAPAKKQGSAGNKELLYCVPSPGQLCCIAGNCIENYKLSLFPD